MKTESMVERMRAGRDVRFTDLVKVCRHYFGEPRQRGTSHLVFKMPWAGNPRVIIQNKGGKAKPYQIKQALEAIDKLEREHKT